MLARWCISRRRSKASVDASFTLGMDLEAMRCAIALRLSSRESRGTGYVPCSQHGRVADCARTQLNAEPFRRTTASCGVSRQTQRETAVVARAPETSAARRHARKAIDRIPRPGQQTGYASACRLCGHLASCRTHSTRARAGRDHSARALWLSTPKYLAAEIACCPDARHRCEERTPCTRPALSSTRTSTEASTGRTTSPATSTSREHYRFHRPLFYAANAGVSVSTATPMAARHCCKAYGHRLALIRAPRATVRVACPNLQKRPTSVSNTPRETHLATLTSRNSPQAPGLGPANRELR